MNARVLGMGKSQRYQAAVDGHDTPPGSLEFFSEKTLAFWRPEPEYGKTSTDSWGRSGEGLAFSAPLWGRFLLSGFPAGKEMDYDP